MKVLDIRNITRKEGPLHYRTEFTGIAVIDSSWSGEKEDPIEFSLERTAFGTKQVGVRFVNVPDYPVLPVIKHLKTFILNLEKEGKLN